MVTYPAKLDTTVSLPDVTDSLSNITGDCFNRLRDAILVIEQELGVKAKSTYSSVAERIATLETTVGNEQIISLTHDLGGSLGSPNVVGLQGRPVDTAAPSLNYVLTWNGLAWTPAAPTGGGGGSISFGGDLSGTSSSQNVIGLQGRALANTMPTFHQTIGWTGSNWAPLTLTQDDIGPAFTINSFSGPSLREVGQSTIHPGFTATYSASPTALTLSDSDNSTPTSVIGTPNSFSSTFTFTKNTYGASVAFVLVATRNFITKSAGTAIQWAQKIYWGVGAAGLSTASDIQNLSNSMLSLTKSTTFTITAGTTDKIYVAYRTGYGPATFTVGGFSGGFSATSTTISVTNAYSFTENYTLYESDNVNLGTITVVVS